jgi:hypothetical protein
VKRLGWVLAIVVGAAGAHADEVRLTNGDRLTGTITRVADGALAISTELVGDLSIPMDKVETFSTDAPIELHLEDGSVVHQAVEAGVPGEIRTAGGEVVGAQTIPLTAISAVNPEYDAWSGSISAGALVTRGNSENETLNADVEIVRRGRRDRLTLGANYLTTRQETSDGDEETTADTWTADGKYDFFHTQRFYTYAGARAERDRIAEVLLRFIPSLGVGYQWYQGPNFLFDTEAGLSWVFEELDCENDPPGSGSCTDEIISEDHLAARLAYHGLYHARDGLTLFHNIEYFPSLEDVGDFNVITDAGVRVSLIAGLFAELKGELRHDQTPAPDADRNDWRYLFNVGWAFD